MTFPTGLNLLWLFIFVVVATYGLNIATWLVRKYIFNIDTSERKEILEREVQVLKNEHSNQQIVIADLQKQNKIFVENYEGVVVKLADLQKKYDELENENRQLQEHVDSLLRISEKKKTRNDKVLYVVVGSTDSGLSLDLANLRAVETETGLDVQEIKNPTPESIERKLSVVRGEKSQIYLHLAVKADKEGYQIGSKIVDATWLSSILDGVLVLVVAGTDSSYVGEFLGVVPYVITMRGGVSNRDSAIFSKAFWTEIGRGIGPTLALKRSLARSPESIRESIVSHWQTS